MKINLSTAREITALSGFGGSAAWWSPQVNDDNTARELAELFYGDSGLRLNIYRYNVGGGFDKDNLRIKNPWRHIESFMNADGTFDWSRDKNGVRMMKYALETGNVDTLIFFANSPHYTQTVTGQTSGGFEEHFSNLAKDKYDSFAKYMIDIAEHFISQGYPVKYISPINEPQWKWGGGYVWQEGCHYEPQEVCDCFAAFARELERRNSPLMLYGPESGCINDHTKEYYSLLSSQPLIMKHLGAFAYHSYHSDSNAKEKHEFGKWAAENVKTPRFDMSEWCELPCKSDIASIDGALITARIIGEDLIYSGAQSWTAWVCANQRAGAVKDDGRCCCDGLIAAEDDFSGYTVAMRYYAVWHYSRFLPPGSVSLDASFTASGGLSVFPFKDSCGRFVLVAVNSGRAARVLEPDIPFCRAQVVSTSQEKQLKSETVSGKKITVAPKSIATVVLKMNNEK